MGGRRTIAGLRWWMIGLVMLGAILNYLTRAVLGVAAPTLMADLHITAREYSWITSAFQGTIMLQPLSGWVLDVMGLKYGFAVFAFAWSLICMAHGLAHDWRAFAGLRGLLGLAEGSAHPAGMKTSALWFPARERGFAAGLYNIGASLGSMLAPPLVAFAILWWNWQSAFVIAGGAGLVWLLLWLAFFQTPDRHKGLSESERAYIVSGQEAGLQAVERRPPILSILKQRNFWGIALPRFLADPTWGTLAFWAPLYLMTVRHLNLKEIALYGWLPFLAADLGCLFAPTVVLFLQKLGVRLITARRLAFTLGALMMIGAAFTGFVQSPVLAIALLSLAGFAHQTLSITVITMASDLFRRSEVATVAGMAGTWGNFGILVFSLILGAKVSASGFAPFFVGLPILDLIGAALLWILVREPKEVRA